MITHARAKNRLLKMANDRDFKFQEWMGDDFYQFKLASATEKGDIGEDFLAHLLQECRYTDVEVVRGRRGQYDVRVAHGKKEILFEVKVATLDTNNSFQFNGIRYDTNYTHLFCLGISPNDIGFLFVERGEVGRPPHKVVSMTRGANATFKLTKKSTELHSFSGFQKSIAEIFASI